MRYSIRVFHGTRSTIQSCRCCDLNSSTAVCDSRRTIATTPASVWNIVSRAAVDSTPVATVLLCTALDAMATEQSYYNGAPSRSRILNRLSGGLTKNIASNCRYREANGHEDKGISSAKSARNTELAQAVARREVGESKWGETEEAHCSAGRSSKTRRNCRRSVAGTHPRDKEKARTG